ncbi:MAG: cation-translocating P-type ATPase [Burkholderiales bacterium]
MPSPDMPISQPVQGLTELEARERLAREGPNELPVSPSRGLVRLLTGVVLEPMFLLLLACGVIYLLLGDVHEALMLLAFVFVIMGITLVQERRSERSLQALRDLSSPRALVIRGGQTQRIASRELVLGDVVMLAEGDRVPADIALEQASNLSIDESLLTGESGAIRKCAQHASPDRVEEYTAFCGTLVTQGNAWGRVVATGRQSSLGRIGHSLVSIATGRTPLQQEIGRLVRLAAMGGLLLAATLAWVYGWTRGDWLHGLLAGLTLAMGILPEELPVVLTIFMGLGAWRLAKENVLTRHTPAIELLGATTVLCVDKTGTLTTNHMVVRQLYLAHPTFEAHTLPPLPSKDKEPPHPLPESFHELLEFAILASHRRAFDPTETAIAESGHLLLSQTEPLHSDWRLIKDYPLSNELLAMSRVWRSTGCQEYVVACKGAPEALLSLCGVEGPERDHIDTQLLQMAHQGLRVLGVAKARFPEGPLPERQEDFHFTFLGLVGLEDPLRADVPEAIAECQSAGIRVVMITGDHAATALSIARQAGLGTATHAMTGAELAQLSDDDLQKRLLNTPVFCRVKPEQKLRLVDAFRARGDIVAMTGDGVNDAPALKAAHIGVAMGARGTDVAREAASLVLLKDDFASLVTAVRHGRRIFFNLRKTMVFLIAVHVPIIGLSALPVMWGAPLLLMPVHILLLQLIIDPACSIVFEAEPAEPGTMTSPPRAPKTKLLDRQVLARGGLQGFGLLSVLLLTHWISQNLLQNPPNSARAMVITLLVLSSLGLILINRSWTSMSWFQATTRNPAFIISAVGVITLMALIFQVPPLQKLLAFEAFTQTTAWLVIAFGLAINLAWFEWVKRMHS